MSVVYYACTRATPTSPFTLVDEVVLEDGRKVSVRGVRLSTTTVACRW